MVVCSNKKNKYADILTISKVSTWKVALCSLVRWFKKKSKKRREEVENRIYTLILAESDCLFFSCYYYYYFHGGEFMKFIIFQTGLLFSCGTCFLSCFHFFLFFLVLYIFLVLLLLPLFKNKKKTSSLNTETPN